MSKNGRHKKQIQRQIDDFKKKRNEANAEVERAEKEANDYKRPRVREVFYRAESAFFFDVDRPYLDLLDKRKGAIATRHALDVRIGELRKDLRMLGES